MADSRPPLFADFHFHSKYSRAVSQHMDLHGLSEGASRKGLGLIGTGDFSHPAWFAELRNNLEEIDGRSLFQLKGNPFGTLYMLTNEVATFYSTPRGVKKVHHIIHAPSFEIVQQLNDVYARMGNLSADGRPMFGNTSSAEFVEKTIEVSRDITIYPAHCWTPHFGALGSVSGYDSLEECYEDQVKHIHALETGMSAEPAMCWRVSTLDKFTLLSNSDAHSNHPWRLGRECNAFSFSKEEVSYKHIAHAIERKDRDALLFTVETNPAYGKYHFDGHRACGFSCDPQESKKRGNRCPVCKKMLTIGVEHRVQALADRPQEFVPPHAIPFRVLLPLHELLSAVFNAPLASKKVSEEGTKVMNAFASELFILLYAPEEDLAAHASHPQVVSAIMRNREGKIAVTPGFDGEYGVPVLPASMQMASRKKSAPTEGKQTDSQKKLKEFEYSNPEK